MPYPVDLEVDYPDQMSRLLWLVKGWLVIPHWIVLVLFGFVVALATWVAMFAILFTGRYPKSIFDLVASYARWNGRVMAYGALLRDEYPPFSGDEEPGYPVRLTLEEPEHLSRWLWLVKGFLAIPHGIALMFYAIAVMFVPVFVGWVILFTGRFPRGLFDFVVGYQRWTLRVNAYAQWQITDQYPPFSGKPSREIP